MPETRSNIDFASLRDRLRAADAPAYWRSLEELAGTPDFREALDQEFPAMANLLDSGVSRRTLLKVMAASLAMMGLNGCFYKEPEGTLVPYPSPPQELMPGKPMYFATAMPFNGYGKGVLALSREGRPIKIEGNPDHPASLGATDVFMQASILDLYDPDRSRNVLSAGLIAKASEFSNALGDRLQAMGKNGAGLRLLVGANTSPAVAAQLNQFTKQFPGAMWHQYDPIRHPHADNTFGIFQTPVEAQYDFSKAGVIVSLGSDFLHRDPANLRNARQFSDGRRVRAANKSMSRLYVIESTMTITGSMADNRLPLRPSQIEAFARALAERLGAQLPAGGSSSQLPSELTKWIEAIATELTHPRDGKSTVVIAGDSQSAAVQAIAHLINQKLGNIGKSVFYTDPVMPAGGHSLHELTADISANKVSTLLILGGNPAYNAPADIPFAEVLSSMSNAMQGGKYARFTAHLATHYDETSYRCQWHLPQAHWLEAWGDVRAFDGTASIIQPLIAPLYGGRSDIEFMESLLGRPERTGFEVIRGQWMQQVPRDFDAWWTDVLQRGIVPGSAFKHRDPPPLRADIFAGSPTTLSTTAQSGAIEIVFEPDPHIWSGEFANNAWLQELPKPFTKLTWDNAALISIRMAEKLGGGKPLQDGDVVHISYRGREVEAPVMLLPGQADNLIALQLGYGRTRGGEVLLEENNPRGYNAYALRTSDAPWASAGATVTTTGRTYALAITRNHHAMSDHADVPGDAPWLKPESIATPEKSEADLTLNNRRIIRAATLEQFKSEPDFVEKLDPAERKPLLSLYPGWDYKHGLQWGMSIDMTACIGCNACVVACQSENNIPVVGKKEVARQREMHWIRIDDYFGGAIDSPTIYHQPVPCMHCENAPCEYVCPVGATTHSDEGLNEMTYNRCVGTRYCSNNCPYKVRRFNFFLYSDYETPATKLRYNPDVTVRSRGVMEKCTYCVQRIDRTRIEMEKQVLDLTEKARQAENDQERQKLQQQAEQRGREIVRTLETACQQACPTRAIEFGDIRDPGSKVTALKNEPNDYSLLNELTTKPRTTYLARISNPNPSLAAGG